MNVRIKDDPSKIGVATDVVREMNCRIYRTIRLSDGQLKAFLESRLEPLLDMPDALSDLAAERFSAAGDLGRLLTHIA
jgi:hypothetical protein